jgi:hypothetical protein
MKQLFLIALLGSATLSAQYSVSVYARSRPYRAELFDRVQDHLECAARNSYPNNKLNRAFQNLGEFRSRYNSGQPAKHELDNAIAAVSNLTKSDVLRPHDHDVLQNDLISMRQFRLSYHANVY